MASPVNTALALAILAFQSALSANAGLTPYIATVNYFAGGIERYDATTGALIDTIGNLSPWRSELTLGPDGSFYVTKFSYSNDFAIQRIDARTGVTTTFVDASAFGSIRGSDFGPNGNLFVAAPDRGAILEFNGRTGQYIRDFVVGAPLPIDLDFAPDGTLYVAGGHHQAAASSVRQYDGQTGAFLRTFTTTQVDTPQGILVGPTGDVFVTNQWSRAAPLVRFDGNSGAVKFAVSGGLRNPQGMTLGLNGELLVASFGDKTIKRFNVESGELLGNLVARGGAFDPVGIVFVPEPHALFLCMVTVPFVKVAKRRRTQGCKSRTRQQALN
jgi:DNA-binding beta-propeller fold protein YncE